jgi:hypothetical protein
MSSPYNGPVIQEPETKVYPVLAPQIESVRAVVHDGEVYLNGRDLAIAMRKVALTRFTSVSVICFIKSFIQDLIRG